MSQLVLNRGINTRSKALKKFLNSAEFGPYFLVASLCFFVVLVTVITLVFSTRQVTKGYVLNKLEDQHQTLIKEGEQKQMQISKVRSLNYIEQSSKVSSMVRPEQIAFVSDAPSALASR